MYQKRWNKAGLPGKKMAEVEHLELLLDAFLLVNDQGLNQLVDFVGHLKTELENWVKAGLQTVIDPQAVMRRAGYRLLRN
jgi:hypothetical protein